MTDHDILLWLSTNQAELVRMALLKRLRREISRCRRRGEALGVIRDPDGVGHGYLNAGLKCHDDLLYCGRPYPTGSNAWVDTIDREPITCPRCLALLRKAGGRADAAIPAVAAAGSG